MQKYTALSEVQWYGIKLLDGDKVWIELAPLLAELPLGIIAFVEQINSVPQSSFPRHSAWLAPIYRELLGKETSDDACVSTDSRFYWLAAKMLEI